MCVAVVVVWLFRLPFAVAVSVAVSSFRSFVRSVVRSFALSFVCWFVRSLVRGYFCLGAVVIVIIIPITSLRDCGRCGRCVVVSLRGCVFGRCRVVTSALVLTSCIECCGMSACLLCVCCVVKSMVCRVFEIACCVGGDAVCGVPRVVCCSVCHYGPSCVVSLSLLQASSFACSYSVAVVHVVVNKFVVSVSAIRGFCHTITKRCGFCDKIHEDVFALWLNLPALSSSWT